MSVETQVMLNTIAISILVIYKLTTDHYRYMREKARIKHDELLEAEILQALDVTRKQGSITDKVQQETTKIANEVKATVEEVKTAMSNSDSGKLPIPEQIKLPPK